MKGWFVFGGRDFEVDVVFEGLLDYRGLRFYRYGLLSYVRVIIWLVSGFSRRGLSLN